FIRHLSPITSKVYRTLTFGKVVNTISNALPSK
ncbi:MAG: hypothetical protein ACI82S_000415, partial [Patiriisocius sp.]